MTDRTIDHITQRSLTPGGEHPLGALLVAASIDANADAIAAASVLSADLATATLGIRVTLGILGASAAEITAQALAAGACDAVAETGVVATAQAKSLASPRNAI